MSKYKLLGDVFSEALKKNTNTLPLINAEVVSIEGESCTVKIDELIIDEVRLKATINGSNNKVIVQPKIGTMVLIGSLTGDLKDLAVLSVDEIEKLLYEQDDLKIEIDSTDKKIKIENDQVGLKSLFQSLTDLLKQFKVFTSTGPSGTPLPTTITSLTQFENDFKKLLK